MTPQSPLASFRLLSTCCVEEAQEVVSRELADSRIHSVKDEKRFRFDMNGVHFGDSLIAWNRYATHTKIENGTVEDTVALVLGIRLPVFRMDDGSVACTPSMGVVVTSSRMAIERPAGSSIYVLKTTYQAVVRRFREFTKREPKGRIQFDRKVNILAGPGAEACRVLMHVVSQLETSDTLLKNRLLRVAIDDLLISTLVSLPHNHTDQLLADPGDAAPSVVRRAEEYMEAHAAEPIKIRDVVEACGCSSSLLYRAFERFRGYTPTEFLTSQRLESTRRMLLSPSPSDTVKSIALACGFPHLGRFAATYQRRFGETPSATLRRAR